MIVTGNPLLTGVSGKIKNLVVKQYKGKTVITTIPDMSGRKLSRKQKEVNERMQMAIVAAKGVMADPRLKQRACEMLQVTPNKVFRAIVRQFLLTDGYGSIFEETGQEKLDKQTLTTLITDPPQALKWELQEKLFHITIQQGTRANILLVPKDQWYTAPEYEMLRTRIAEELMPVKAFLKECIGQLHLDVN